MIKKRQTVYIGNTNADTEKLTMIKYSITILLLCTYVNKTEGQNAKISDNFPCNCIVKEWWPSCYKGTYYFFPSGKYVFEHGGIGYTRKQIDIGTWERRQYQIFITIDTIVGIRGVGEPLNDEANFAANPDDYYHFKYYAPYEKWVKESQVIPIEGFLREDCEVDTSILATTSGLQLDEYRLKGVYKIASCKLLKEADLKDYSKAELRLMRNEIFARYGYSFKSEQLKSYFSSKKWYYPSDDYNEKFLNYIEKQNIRLIREMESHITD